MQVGVLASGSGTILRAILDRGLPVAVVVADRSCGALDIARDSGVPVELVERTDFSQSFDRAAYTERIVAALRAHGVDLVAIAGFGTILSPSFVEAFGARALNTHPALLPAFKGWHAVRDALEAGVDETGCTVHLVTEDVDSGPILAQEAVAVLEGDTEETLHERIKEVERRLYPDVIEQMVRASERSAFVSATKIERALLSVWDKAGLVDLARALHEMGVELVSSGNTSAALNEAGIPVTRVEDVTGSPEMLDGRVKTLHPKIHGGLLADRGKESHRADLDAHGIRGFDLVVSNLYPFFERPDIETIDIGGPAMTRAAAKNHAWVTIVTSPDQYQPLLDELRATGGEVSAATRRAFALEAFARTAAYDAAIVQWLQQGEELPAHIVLALDRTDETLRYGENPHQRAARYRRAGTRSWWDDVEQHGGLALSYLNYYDADAAWLLVHDLGIGPACAIIKHANPCGVSVDADLATAYQRALECDERSAFGGIVALNQVVDEATVERMVAGPQADVVIARGYADGVIDALRQRRKNTRILTAPEPIADPLDVRQISGGFLVQDPHHFAATRNDWRVVTKAAPTPEQWVDLELAWRICGHVKSNSIVLVKDRQAVGIGAGQQNRVESGEIAAKKAAGRARGGACASDAFYPFEDGIEAAAGAGVAAVIQPGGSMRDDAIIEKADELGLAMVFTGERHFFH